MALLTSHHRTGQALRFLAAAGKYMGIGRTTPWADESNPPAESDPATLEEPVGYKPLSKQTLVVPDAAGTLSFGGQTWREVGTADAYTEEARHVYVEARLEYDEPPLVQYRQAALLVGLEKASGAGFGALTPEMVVDPGVVEMLDNRVAESRAADKVDILGLILQF